MVNSHNSIVSRLRRFVRRSRTMSSFSSSSSFSYIIVIATAMLTVSCSDIFDTASTQVVTEDNYSLSSAADSVYSVIGILSKVQAIADRTVLMGELRADLVDENEYTTSDLREIVRNDISSTNPAVSWRDYYSVINNCNYYLAHADTTVLVSGQKVLLKEYAVVKAIRAWTYLQLALVYGEVPFYTEPIMKMTDAEAEFPRYNLQQICDYFIADIKPYVDTPLPSYGVIYTIASRKFFFPVRLVLADMYLWSQNYRQAAFWYADYLSKNHLTTGVIASRIGSITTSDEPTSISSTWITPFISPTSEEVITLIPMAENKLEGVKSELSNVFSSTDENDNHYRITPSARMEQLALAQDYAWPVSNKTLKHLTTGDVRFLSTYPQRFMSAISKNMHSYRDDEDDDVLTNTKYSSGHVMVYRVGTVWLRLAEAINRLGRPEDAFAILKNGGEVITRGDSIIFDFAANADQAELARGIHSRGSGEGFRNSAYDLPAWSTLAWSSTDDTCVPIDTVFQRTVVCHGVSDAYGYQETSEWNATHDTLTVTRYSRDLMVEAVEDLILDEMALETAFEGNRFYDLMRVAIRRDDPAVLAFPIAHRAGDLQAADNALQSRLMDKSNWYIHHPF